MEMNLYSKQPLVSIVQAISEFSDKHAQYMYTNFDPYLEKFTFYCTKFILVGQVFYVLLTNKCYLTYNQNYCSAFVFEI